MPTKSWVRPELPADGWMWMGGEHLDIPARCSVCGKTGLKNVHYLSHKDWPDDTDDWLLVGKECALRMAESSNLIGIQSESKSAVQSDINDAHKMIAAGASINC
jgi:hypothetical protein